MGENKYLVLSHSKHLQGDPEYLKQDQVEVSHVEGLIQQALALPEKSWSGLQCLPAYLGLFQKQATPEEKADFMLLLKVPAWAKLAKRIQQGDPKAPRALSQSLLARLDTTRRSIDETVAPRFD